MNLLNRWATLLVVLVMVSCSSKPTSEKAPVAKQTVKATLVSGDNLLSSDERNNGWMLLFDGKSTKGWRGFNKDHFPKNWEVVDGTLHMKGKDMTDAEKADRADLIYDKEFENFIFRLEWKISEGGNSGIFYMGKEGMDKIYKTAPEMQVLDNDKHPDAKKGKDGNRKAGSLYDLIPASPQNVKAVGEWNEVEITINNREVTHKQNGVVVVQYTLDSPEWKEMVAVSKFPKLNPDWANVPTKGVIGLQDHGDHVWFRNLRIKEL